MHNLVELDGLTTSKDPHRHGSGPLSAFRSFQFRLALERKVETVVSLAPREEAKVRGHGTGFCLVHLLQCTIMFMQCNASLSLDGCGSLSARVRLDINSHRRIGGCGLHIAQKCRSLLDGRNTLH